MKTALLLAACLSAVAASAASGAPAAALSGFASAWRQDCADACAVPTAAGKSQAVALSIAVPANPGEARAASFARDFDYGPTGEKVHAAVSLYFVCPPDAAPVLDGGSCPSRYLQVQIALSGDARAFCAAALNPADAEPFPVVMCAGENQRRPGERLGVSLSRAAQAADAALAR